MGIQSAYANPGTRPAFKIAQEQPKLRYIYRGLDHPFTLNEFKDYLFKMRENYLIQKYPGVQYPYVFKQMMPETTPDPLRAPVPQDSGAAASSLTANTRETTSDVLDRFV